MQCAKCVLDDELPGVTLDSFGICNYCHWQAQMERDHPVSNKLFLKHLQEIKHDGKNKEYDCIVGFSGGCDSSYLLHTLVEYGLRPLAVHFDDTWDTAIASGNISKMVSKLGVGYYNHTVDNKIIDDIYKSFIVAGLPDTDAPTDIAITATLYAAADKYGLKYILDAHNFRTEATTPLEWLYFDGKYVDSVWKSHGELYDPSCYDGEYGFPNLWFLPQIKGILKKYKRPRLMYYLDYNKESAKQFLHDEYGWEWYGGHHQENRWSTFSNRWWMPFFRFDLRRVEYSALIRSGQLSQQQALDMLQSPIEDTVYRYTKDRLDIGDLAEYLCKGNRRDYQTYMSWFKTLRPFFWAATKMDLMPRSFNDKYCR